MSSPLHFKWRALNPSQGARKLSDAGRSLMEATHFKELMSVSIPCSIESSAEATLF
jgi:hypothetical protein